MDWVNFTNKHKNIIFNIAVALVVVFIARNFIYNKQLKQFSSLKQEKEIEIKKSAALENISKLEKRINSYKNLLAKKDTNLVISALNNMAKETGAEISSIRPEAEQRFQAYTKIPFSLVMSLNNYHSLGEFISKVESSGDVYTVEDVSIRTTGQGNKLSVNLKVSKIIFK